MPEPGAHGTQHKVKYWCCRNPDYFADLEDIPQSNPHVVTSLILRSPIYDSRDKTASCDCRPFDPLAAGIISYFQFLKGKSAADVYESMVAKEVESFESDGAIVTIVVKDKFARHTLVVNKAMMVPLKLTSSSLTDLSVSTSEAKWKIVDDVAVPVVFRVQLVVPEVAKDANEYKFLWSRVNESFDPSEFEYTAFTEVPPGIIDVMDARGRTEHEYIGRWYADGKIEKPADRARPAAFKTVLPKQQRSWLPVLIAVNIVALVVFLVPGVARAVRRRRNDSGSQ